MSVKTAVDCYLQAEAALKAGAAALKAAANKASENKDISANRNLSEKAMEWELTARNLHTEHIQRYLLQPKYEKYQE